LHGLWIFPKALFSEGEAVVQMVGINDFPGLYVLRGRQGVTGTLIPSYK
jgi:hypothetical protein